MLSMKVITISFRTAPPMLGRNTFSLSQIEVYAHYGSKRLFFGEGRLLLIGAGYAILFTTLAENIRNI